MSIRLSRDTALALVATRLATPGVLVPDDDPILRQPAVLAVADLPSTLQAALGPWLEAARLRWHGLGIAAPQLGLPVQAFAIDPTLMRGVPLPALTLLPGYVADPVLTPSGRPWPTLQTQSEGCLSLPGRRFAVTRPSAVSVTWTTLEGVRLTHTFQGLAARCLQHEADHLEGLLLDTPGRPSQLIA